MALRLDGCSGETLLAAGARMKRPQRKMAKDNYCASAEKILACSVSREMIEIASFTYIHLKDKSGLC